MYIECAELTVTIQEEIIGQCDQKLRKRSGLKVGSVLSQFGSERFHV